MPSSITVRPRTHRRIIRGPVMPINISMSLIHNPKTSNSGFISSLIMWFFQPKFERLLFCFFSNYIFHPIIDITYINPTSQRPSESTHLYRLTTMSMGPFQATVAVMRRFRRLTRGLARKGPSLHPKHGASRFYKGYGARAMGQHTRKAGYIIDWRRKVTEYIVPDLTACNLQPYVSATTPLVKVPPPPGSIGVRRRTWKPRNWWLIWYVYYFFWVCVLHMGMMALSP